MVLGLPTVHRDNQTYLMSTLYNLISCMNETERQDTLIVVYIGEVIT
jgi:N-Acetylglucosaminyltransferase-IV (GnT-IV) conserved region